MIDTTNNAGGVIFEVIYYYPTWVVGLSAWISLILVIEIAYRVGLKSRDKWKDAEIGGGCIVQASMLALLGLVLAFPLLPGSADTMPVRMRFWLRPMRSGRHIPELSF